MTPPITGVNFISWYDASQLTLADGASVTTWPDLAGSGNNLGAGAGTVVMRKSGTRVINDMPTVDFGAGAGYLASASTAQLNSILFTIFIVARLDATAANYALWGARGNFTQIAWSASAPAGMILYQGTAVVGGAISLTKPFVLTALFDGSSSAMRINGSQTGTGTPGTNSVNTGWDVGNVNNGGGNSWEGLIGEIIIYNTNFNLSQMQQTEAYLTTKWLTPLLGGWRQNMPFKRTLERLWTPPKRELWRPALLPC